ncbi:serine protease [Demequina sp. SYSU T00039]|uniref:Serine protease n=1 Tax=Demequina lignilytica TaxID=3051663 RepID=A0AAW7M239_9MICO|nr:MULTISPECIES: serine protease [unclassified Demequina]MDN4477084.1 serine protease [Demequina sp. SYSU T00039-1]MDN4487257.1 serine protease [Demequina sp. SYSU T00039]MDN4491508.1 serine protease [Demequina sp. SYSU T00068]
MSARRVPRRAILAVALAMGAAGCGVIPQAPDPIPSDFVPSPSAEPGDGPGALSPDGFTAAQRMTVRVRSVGCSGTIVLSTGTGFALDEHTLVTNRHVIANSKRITITTYDGRTINVTAATTSTAADIAVITTEESLGNAFAQTAEADPEVGDLVTVVGYPNGGRLTTSSGVVLGATADPLGGAVDSVLATSATVKVGSSGSPALDEDGRVIGVVYAKNISDQSFIVPVSTLNALLEEPALFVPESACAADADASSNASAFLP